MSTKKKQKGLEQNHKELGQEITTDPLSKKASLLDRSEYTLETVNGWIHAADTKVSISCGVFSVIIAAIVFIAENILGDIDKTDGVNNCFLIWALIFGIIAAITFLASELLHLLAISPNLKAGESTDNKKDSKEKEPRFSIFYDEIRQFRSAEDYISAARKSSVSQFEDEILKEVYFNSGICTKKMRKFKYAIWLGWTSIIMTIICSILYYCSYVVH